MSVIRKGTDSETVFLIFHPDQSRSLKMPASRRIYDDYLVEPLAQVLISLGAQTRDGCIRLFDKLDEISTICSLKFARSKTDGLKSYNTRYTEDFGLPAARKKIHGWNLTGRCYYPLHPPGRKRSEERRTQGMPAHPVISRRRNCPCGFLFDRPGKPSSRIIGNSIKVKAIRPKKKSVSDALKENWSWQKDILTQLSNYGTVRHRGCKAAPLAEIKARAWPEKVTLFSKQHWRNRSLLICECKKSSKGLIAPDFPSDDRKGVRSNQKLIRISRSDRTEMVLGSSAVLKATEEMFLFLISASAILYGRWIYDDGQVRLWSYGGKFTCSIHTAVKELRLSKVA